MVIIVGLVAIAVILLIGVGFHFANGARSGKGGVVAQAQAAEAPGVRGGKDRVSGLD